jgi:hypothetical protein
VGYFFEKQDDLKSLLYKIQICKPHHQRFLLVACWLSQIIPITSLNKHKFHLHVDYMWTFMYSGYECLNKVYRYYHGEYYWSVVIYYG